MTTPLPDLPWQRIGVDLCQFERHEYLVMVAIDSHSRWIEILHLTTTTSSAVISKMKDVFARLGLPQEVFSDNGPQFVSEQFRQFAKKCDFNHIMSSPHLPNSNGEAERAVKTAKSILRQEDLWLALMIYRDTVIAATGCSPSQLMMGHHLRTNLPTLGVKLRPSLPNPARSRTPTKLRSWDTNTTTMLVMVFGLSQIYNQEMWLSSRLTRRKAGPLKA